jgi:hypothetical protein
MPPGECRDSISNYPTNARILSSIREQGAEENVSIQKEKNDRRLERLHNEEIHNYL